jgi:hypothetical protein
VELLDDPGIELDQRAGAVVNQDETCVVEPGRTDWPWMWCGDLVAFLFPKACAQSDDRRGGLIERGVHRVEDPYAAVGFREKAARLRETATKNPEVAAGRYGDAVAAREHDRGIGPRYRIAVTPACRNAPYGCPLPVINFGDAIAVGDEDLARPARRHAEQTRSRHSADHSGRHPHGDRRVLGFRWRFEGDRRRGHLRREEIEQRRVRPTDERRPIVGEVKQLAGWDDAAEHRLDMPSVQ